MVSKISLWEILSVKQDIHPLLAGEIATIENLRRIRPVAEPEMKENTVISPIVIQGMYRLGKYCTAILPSMWHFYLAFRGPA